MKRISAEESLRPSRQTIVTCKEKVVKGEPMIRTDLKSYYIPNKSFNLSDEEKEKLIELSSSNPQEFTKKIIEYNLQKPIISFLEGDKNILPEKSKNKQERVVALSTEDTSIYFEDLATLQYRTLISDLKEKARLEMLKRSLEGLKDKNIKRINFGFYNASFSGIQANVAKMPFPINNKIEEEINYYHYLKEKVSNIDVLEDMCKIMDKFIEINGKFYTVRVDGMEAQAFGENGDSVINMYGINNSSYVLNYALDNVKK